MPFDAQRALLFVKCDLTDTELCSFRLFAVVSVCMIANCLFIKHKTCSLDDYGAGHIAARGRGGNTNVFPDATKSRAATGYGSIDAVSGLVVWWSDAVVSDNNFEEVVPRFTVCLTISQCCEGLSITSHDWYKHAVPVSFVLTVHNRNNSIIQELSKVRFMTDGGPGPPGAHARTCSKKTARSI